MIEDAPKLVDFIADESRAHFEALQALLDGRGPRVRDQPAAGARPRLLQPHGVRVGPPSGASARRARSPAAAATTACSSCSAASPARVRLRHRHRAHDPAAAGGAARPRSAAPLAYVVHAGDARGAARAPRRRDAARRTATRSSCNAGGGSFKSQMKKADASGARFALIIGDDEAATRHGRRQAAARRPASRSPSPVARRAGTARRARAMNALNTKD